MASLECRLINACIACYAIENGKIDPNNANLEKVGLKPGTGAKVFVGGKDSINAGLLAETDDDWVVLAFRGTLPPFKGDFWKWVRDWLQDFEIGPVDWTVNDNTFGKVEGGFAKALLSIWNQAWAALQLIDLKSKKGILVTGHSKGAAMTFLAASLLKSAMKDTLVEVCAFAAPLTCDRTFRDNYDALGLRPFSVRYQNEYDLVPFLPYDPTFALLTTAERLDRGAQATRVQESWPENEYVPIGIVRYITTRCSIEYGERAEHDAWAAIKHALLHLEFKTIADAHSADGRYLTCIC